MAELLYLRFVIVLLTRCCCHCRSHRFSP